MRPSESPRIDSLESLRGLAALSVAVAHLQVAFYPDFGHSDEWNVATVAGYATRSTQYMVSIFFVLSGFVLARSFLHSGKPDVLTSAAVRRYPRLVLPCLAAILVAYLLRANGFIHNHEAVAQLIADGIQKPGCWLDYMYIPEPSLDRAFGEALWNMFFSYDGYWSFNVNLWTMSSEFLGSFVVFGTLGIFGRGRPLLLAAAIITALCIMKGWPLIALFVVGMALAELHRLIRRRLPGLAALPLAALSLWFGGHVAASGLTLPLTDVKYDHNSLNRYLAAIGLVAAVAFSPALGRSLQFRPFLFLGKISFGLYLIHVPLLASLFSYAYLALRMAGWSYNATVQIIVAAYVPTILLAGYLMYLCADRPAIGLSRILYNVAFRPRTPADAAKPMPAGRRLRLPQAFAWFGLFRTRPVNS